MSTTPVISQTASQSFTKLKLYQAFCAEREEILRHKWILSEKEGRDIGFDAALIDWTIHHHAGWRRDYIARLHAENMA